MIAPSENRFPTMRPLSRPAVKRARARTLIAHLVLLAWSGGFPLMGAFAAETFRDPAPPPYPDHTRLLVVRDAQGNERPVKTAADWEIRRGHILAHLQEVMEPLPGKERRVAVDVRVSETHQERGYTRQKISFASEPGDRVPAWLLVPDGGNGDAKKRRPAMRHEHGRFTSDGSEIHTSDNRKSQVETIPSGTGRREPRTDRRK